MLKTITAAELPHVFQAAKATVREENRVTSLSQNYSAQPFSRCDVSWNLVRQFICSSSTASSKHLLPHVEQVTFTTKRHNDAICEAGAQSYNLYKYTVGHSWRERAKAMGNSEVASFSHSDLRCWRHRSIFSFFDDWSFFLFFKSDKLSQKAKLWLPGWANVFFVLPRPEAFLILPASGELFLQPCLQNCSDSLDDFDIKLRQKSSKLHKFSNAFGSLCNKFTCVLNIWSTSGSICLQTCRDKCSTQ